MFPWYWLWSPQVRFPLSGSVLQDISPDLGWFFGGINPEAGVGAIEKEAFAIASYGRQLGLILDLLLPLLGEGSLESEKARKSLAELKVVYGSIEDLKAAKKGEMEKAAVSLLRRIEKTDGDMLRRVLDQFETGGGPQGG